MNKVQFIGAFLVGALLISCSPKNTDEKPHGVLTDAQKQTLDKAKKTEDLLEKANKERMKDVDEAATDK
jgi:acyl-CoA synthetase (AMP-forming)/AMP-acid ligase II